MLTDILTFGFEVSVKRKVLKDFTFSNGITIPAGYTISIPHRSIHRDPVRV